MDKQCCGTCQFFLHSESVENEGTCRRHAPTINHDPQNHGVWPVINIREWCGEWEQDPLMTQESLRAFAKSMFAAYKSIKPASFSMQQDTDSIINLSRQENNDASG